MHDSLLSNLCIGQLADLVGGHLRLGCLPPLGGHLEPVGPVCLDSCGIRPGDVFWGLKDPAAEHSREAEVAFLREAAGAVVCGRKLEPWAGKYSIEVRDTRRALWQLARHVRDQFDGPVIGLIGDPSGQLAEGLKTVLGQRAGTGERTGTGERVGGGSGCRQTAIRLPLELLSLTEDDRAAVFSVPVASSLEIRDFSALCDPWIVVINSTRNSDTEPFGPTQNTLETYDRLRESTSHQTHLLLLERVVGSPGGEPRISLTCVPPEGELPSVATARRVRAGQTLYCEVDGQPLEIPGATESDLPLVLAAREIGRLLGQDPRQVSHAIGAHLRASNQGRPASGQPLRHSNSKDIAEASPFAPDLRESGATLPPGLERFAC